MTRTAKIYGDALYDLARDEGLTAQMLSQLTQVQALFAAEPDYLRLLSAASLSKAERCGLLDTALRGSVEPYLLNFLKILCEKGHLRQLKGCAQEFRLRYNEDNGILQATAITAVPLTDTLRDKLTKKLEAVTGKQIDLLTKVDERVLGGVRLELDGHQLDGTVRNRLDALRRKLNETVL